MGRILKILTAIAVISAAGISLSYAETIWEKRQKALNPETQPKAEQQKAEEIAAPAKPVTLDPADPFNITVPAMYGTIIDSYKGTNGKLIVHIQDAHANYEAQKNIAGIIESLLSGYDMKLIFREGGSTDKDFTYLRKEAGLDARIRASEKLLKNATITAIDYVNLTTDYPMTIQGIEERALYDENRFSILELDKFRDVASDYVKKMSLLADALKPKIYNQDLMALDKAKKDYEAEASDLLAYYKALNEIVQKKGITTAEYPNFSALIKINDMEKKIDFVKVNSPEATEDQKKLYAEYQKALKDLSVNKLFKEEPLIENKIQEAVSDNNDQKELFRISKAISLMGKMLNVKLVPEEYGYFLQNKKDFDPNEWANFLTKKSEELNLGLKAPENSYALTDNTATLITEAVGISEIIGDKEKALNDCIAKIKKDNLKERMALIQDAIRVAHNQKNDSRVTELVSEYNELVKLNNPRRN